MRNILSEASSIKVFSPVSVFANGDTMSITVYKDGSSTPESLTAGTLTELGSTGIFWWSFSDLVNAPTVLSQYYWTMQDTTTKETSGSETFGGWPETVTAIAGANQVTITVDDGSDPIADVSVQVLNAAQTLVLDNKDTNASGQVVFALDDGAYKIRLAKAQYSFTVPEDLTVSGTTVDTYSGAAIVITPGSGAGECEVSIFAASQRPTVNLANLEGSAEIISLPAELSGIFYPGLKVKGTYDSVNGRIYWVLPRGATVQFKVDDLGISSSDAQKAIPDSASADYKDL